MNWRPILFDSSIVATNAKYETSAMIQKTYEWNNRHKIFVIADVPWGSPFLRYQML